MDHRGSLRSEKKMASNGFTDFGFDLAQRAIDLQPLQRCVSPPGRKDQHVHLLLKEI